jgi:hypothetical protein
MSQKNLGVRDLRPIAAPLYAAAIMFTLVPLIDLAAQIGFSARPGNLQWRTGTVGLLSSAVLTPAFGLILATITAYAFEHRWSHRILTWLCGIAAIALVAITALFALDAFQLRATVNPQIKHSFAIAMLKAILNLGITAAALGLVWLNGLRAGGRGAPSRARRGEGTELPLIARQ